MHEKKIIEAGIAIPALMEATMFAAEKHRDQRRKAAQATPHINHPIMVVNLMANVGSVNPGDAGGLGPFSFESYHRVKSPPKRPALAQSDH